MKILRMPNFGRQQRTNNDAASPTMDKGQGKSRPRREPPRGFGTTKPSVNDNIMAHSPPSKPPFLLSKLLQSEKTIIIDEKHNDACRCSPPTATDEVSCTASHEEDRDELSSSKNNHFVVRFNLSVTVYREDEQRDMSNEDQWAEQWYAVSDIQTFRQAQMSTANNLLDNSFRLSPEEAQQADEWKTVLQQEYKECAAAEAAIMLEDETTSSNNNDSQSSGCRSSQEEALIQLYLHQPGSSDESNCWVGLETNLLARFRGKARRQSRFILEQVDKKNQQTEGSESSSTSGDEETTRSMSIESSIRTVTAPSLRFAQRVAQAHAQALLQEEEQERRAAETPPQ